MSVLLGSSQFVELVIRLFIVFPQAYEVSWPFTWLLSALSVNIGNAIALVQTNIVRKIAYSSVSHDRLVLI